MENSISRKKSFDSTYMNKIREEWSQACKRLKNSGYDLSKIEIIREEQG